MRKAIIIFPFFLFILNCCFSQFQITNSNSDYFLNCCEYLNGKTAIIGTVYDENLQKYLGKTMIIDQQGTLIDQRTYSENSGNLIFANIFFKEDRFYIFSIFSSQTVNKLVYYQIDTSLNILETKYYSTPLDENIGFLNTTIDSDCTFIITGYTQFPNSRMFFNKINQYGDSILFKYSNQTNQFAYKSYESIDHSKYILFIDGFYPQFGYGGLLQLNKTFDTLEFHYITPYINKIYSSITFHDSLFLVMGTTLDDYILKVMKIDLNGNLLDSNFYYKEDEMKETPALLNGIAMSGVDYYIGSTSNIDYHDPNYSLNDSWFHLIKVDQNLETIWENFYGGDAYYILRSITATSDGGCLMVGTKYPHGIGNQFLQGHYVKVDSNGNVQWTQDIEIPELSYKVYPNPTQSVFNIENSELNIQSIELCDISGRYLKSIQDCNNSTISIDLTPFPNGIYFAKIKSSKGLRTEKVVKN